MMTRTNLSGLAVLAAWAWCATPASGQALPGTPATPTAAEAAAPAATPLAKAIENAFVSLNEPDDNRACPGCPKRRVGLAVTEVLGINLLYNLTNLVIKPEEEKIYFKTYYKTWWANMTYGFEWDDNTFQVNQFGHPYQGNNYFNAGRANGLSFWESAPLAALGSLTWEYYGERHKPSLNDFVMTTVGGISLGEMTHRVAWLIRDPSKTGWARTWRELLALGIDPVTGFNRYATGEAGRTTEKPETFRPSVLTASTELGMLWRGEDTSLDEAPALGYAQLGLGYGTLLSGKSEAAFDAFRLDLRLGGGGPISEATVRGRLCGRDVGTDGAASSAATHLNVMMAYDYHSNTAYQFGGQTILAAATHRRPFGGDWQFTVGAYGGAMLLGAMDSLYVKGEQRAYDYGPGVAYGANAALVRRGFTIAKLATGGMWLHTIDGAEAEHFAHSIRFELLAPLWRGLAIGSAGEFIQRDSRYDNFDDVSQRFPQVRVYLSWLK